MKAKILKNDDDELITKGFLRSEFKREFSEFEKRFEKKMDEKFEYQFQKLADIIQHEGSMMREETRKFYQMREQLYDNDIRQDKAIDKLDQRILKLENAK